MRSLHSNTLCLNYSQSLEEGASNLTSVKGIQVLNTTANFTPLMLSKDGATDPHKLPRPLVVVDDKAAQEYHRQSLLGDTVKKRKKGKYKSRLLRIKTNTGWVIPSCC